MKTHDRSNKKQLDISTPHSPRKEQIPRSSSSLVSFFAIQRAIRQPSQVTLTPKAIVQMQRIIGNRATLRFIQRQQAETEVAEKVHDQEEGETKTSSEQDQQIHEKISTTPANHTVQRLLGFEFETNFPAANMAAALDQGGKTGETEEETDLRKYLSGQAHANEAIHDFPGDDFEAVADHGPPGAAIERSRQWINYEMGFATPPSDQLIEPGTDKVDPKPGIVEYKTVAFDESTETGLNDMVIAVWNLAAHMVAVGEQIETNGLAEPPLSSPDWYIGVPPENWWARLGQRYNIAPKMAKQRNRIKKTFNMKISPQITVGVLPRNIPKLFFLASKLGHTKGQDPNIGGGIKSKTSQLRVTDAEAVARRALTKVGKKHSAVRVGDDTIGYITILAQYVFGSFVDKTKAFETSKNLAIFLSKTPLTGAQDTILVANQRPQNWGRAANEALVDALWKEAAKRYNATKPQKAVNATVEGAFTKDEALHILKRDRANDEDPFTESIMNRTIGLDPHRYPNNPNVNIPNREIPLEFRGLEDIDHPKKLMGWAESLRRMMMIVNQ